MSPGGPLHGRASPGDPGPFGGPGSAVLDGGLATELEARGHDLSGALWSARLLADDPDAIVAAHRAFLAAGADVVTSASYQASFPGLAAAGIPPAQTAALLRRSVALAREAVASVGGRRRWVAASVGPYGAAQADGGEYRGRYGLGVAALAEWHRPRLEVLADAGPDLLACETVPDAVEAEALVRALPDGIPAWLTYSVAGSRTRAGQPLAEAFGVVADAPQVVAVGVNCCDPADVGPAVAVARAVTGKPVVVYPNSGEEWDARARRWTGRRRFTAATAAGWVAAGAAAVGGCCRVRPADIAAVAAAVRPPARARHVADAVGSSRRSEPLRGGPEVGEDGDSGTRGPGRRAAGADGTVAG